MEEVFKTLRLRVYPEDLESATRRERIAKVSAILRSGGTVALPTETVYGLGANALDAAAVEKIFVAKERPHWDPLIVHVSDDAMLASVVSSVPERARLLMEAFWPGPLTLLLPRSSALPLAVTAGRDLVGVRMPEHPVALAVIRAAGVPVAAPSANRFGHVSPTTAEHVLADLDGRIDAVVDGGPTRVGVESTVLSVGDGPAVLYRPGAITVEQIEKIVGAVEVYRAPVTHAEPEALPSPGVGIRHYAPRARIVLVASEAELMRVASVDGRVGVMLPEGWAAPAGAVTFAWGAWGDLAELARRLFSGLRELDAAGVAVIACPLPVAKNGGAADALRDRLMKAAREK